MPRSPSKADKMMILPMFPNMPLFDMEAAKKRALEDVQLLERLESENGRLQEEIQQARATGNDKELERLMRLNAQLGNQRSACFDRVASAKAMGLIKDGG